MTKTMRHTPLLAFGEVIVGYANCLVNVYLALVV